MSFLDEPFIRYREEQARKDAEELAKEEQDKDAQGDAVGLPEPPPKTDESET